MADLVPKGEGKLGLIVHQPHQLARDIDEAARRREGILDGRIEHCEAIGLGSDSRICGDAAPDGIDVARARPCFGAAELIDQLGMILLGFLDIPRIDPAHGCLRHGRGGARHQRGGAEEKERSTHGLSLVSLRA